MRTGEHDVISGVNVNEVLAQELYKPVIKKFKIKKLHAMFKDNISVLIGFLNVSTFTTDSSSL